MDSNQNAPKENNEDQLNISDDINLKKASKALKRGSVEYELAKRGHRNPVYYERPFGTPIHNGMQFLFSKNKDNSREFLERKYKFIISKYEKIIEESSNINKKLEENNKQIEELNKELKNLKEEKKKNQANIVNYLSKKESLEEVYKNQIAYLVHHKNQEKSKSDDKKNNDNSYTLKSQDMTDSQIISIEEEKEIDIKIEEIKKSYKTKYAEQAISLAEDILQKKCDMELSNKIKSKIKIAYNIFFSEISSNSPVDYELVISHFFSRVGLYISNNSLGKFSEAIINKFLRYLVKINSINVEISQILKFLNKKYKEKKIEMKNKIKDLKKNNEDLIEKKKIDDKNIEKYKKIIQMHKDNLENLKEDNNKDNKKEKRKYMIHTLDRTNYKKDNNLNIVIDENNMNENNQILTALGKENEVEKLPRIILTKESLKTEIPKEKRKSSNSKSTDKEKKEKNNEKSISNQDNKKNNIIITKNTKILLKKTVKQLKVNIQSNLPKDLQSNTDYNAEAKTLNSNSNLNYFDDSKDADSEITSKNLNNSNSINQNYILIKNDLDIKTRKHSNILPINNIKSPNIIQHENIKVRKSNAPSNDIIHKYYNGRNEQTQNNNQEKNIIKENNNYEEKEKKNVYDKKNLNYPKAKYNKNIYIINNINNSEQIHTKNTIYGNRANNLNINSSGKTSLRIFNDDHNRTGKNNNYSNSTKDLNKNEIFLDNHNRNKQILNSNNNRINNNNQNRFNKNRPNNNYHDVLQVEQKINNRYQITNPNNNTINNTDYSKYNKVYKRNLNKDNKRIPQTPLHGSIENKAPRIYQKNSYDYKSFINKRNNGNNSNNDYKKNNDKIIRINDKTLTTTDFNNTNLSYKISIYSRKKEKNI